MVARIIEVTRRGRQGEQGNPGSTAFDAVTTAGSSTVYTLTNGTPIVTYADGYGVTIDAHATNGVAPTMNVDGLGAVPIKKLSGGSSVAIVAGDMVADNFYMIHYSAVESAFILFGTDINVVKDLTPQLGGPLDTNSRQINESKGADVASASALTLGADGNIFDVTGTTPITSIGALGVGTTVMLRATAALPLTHHATDLILLGGVSVTLAAGDWVIMTEHAIGKWTMVSVSFPIATFTDATTGTQNTKYMTALRTKQSIDAFNPFGNQLLHVRDEKTAGTDGGSSVIGSFLKRDLNTTLTNEITGATLTSSVISLPAGTYYAEALSPFFNTNDTVIKLRDTTNSADLLVGNGYNFGTAGDTKGDLRLLGRFTLAGTVNIELQYQCSTANATDGLGDGTNFGLACVFSDVRIWKVA